jgi:NAD(P)-dependent dehydrogenase (short-subunit alcohol dehydrogenase family)
MPVGRLAAANEIAQTILFMASDAASFMNGSVVAVGGAR